MNSAQRRDRRERSKQRLHNELKKDLRTSEFEDEPLILETSEASSTCTHQEPLTSASFTIERIAQMETNFSVGPVTYVDITEELFPVMQSPILEDVSEEDNCSMEVENDEEMMFEKDQRFLDTLYPHRNLDGVTCKDQSPFNTILDQQEDIDDVSGLKEEPPTKREMSVILVLLKARHHLTNSCIDDLCSLFIRLGIKNSPRSYQQLKSALSPPKNAVASEEYRVCNECASLLQGKTECCNPKCKLFDSFIKYPMEFLHFPIECQLTSILSRTKIKFYANDTRTWPASELLDVCDGEVYRRLGRTHHDPFITLTLNTDGISISQSSNRSIWVFTAAINEVARHHRFKLNNMLILAVSSSLSKPPKAQMQSMLKPIVDNLKTIENGITFDTPDQGTVWGRVFLLLSCNDKPAQALLQNLGEAHGRFGCGSCTIEGNTTSTGKTTIRVFPSAPTITHDLRTNEWYDQMIETVCNPDVRRVKNEEEILEMTCGHKGACCLRDLSNFDIGQSFANDSLHNVYHGAFRRVLLLLFDDEYAKQNWSCKKKMANIQTALDKVHYPSNTTRVPRPLIYFKKYKGSELRTLLLFGIFAFEEGLPQLQYRHLELLSIAMHLAESRCLKQLQVTEIKHLLDTFVQQYPSIYTARHHTQVIHSLTHVSKTIANFGPLQNYSTFSFESVLGTITSSVHGTRLHAQEIKNNIALSQVATADIERDDFNQQLKLFYIGMVKLKKQEYLAIIEKTSSRSTYLSACSQLDESESLAVQQQLHCKADHPFYKVLFVGKVRFTVSDGKMLDDGCVAFNDGKGTLEAGFIRAITHSDSSNIKTVVYVEKFIVRKCLAVKIDVGNQSSPVNVICSDFAFIQLSDQIVPISPSNLIEKLSYIQINTKDFIIIRYPNLVESS